MLSVAPFCLCSRMSPSRSMYYGLGGSDESSCTAWRALCSTASHRASYRRPGGRDRCGSLNRSNRRLLGRRSHPWRCDLVSGSILAQPTAELRTAHKRGCRVRPSSGIAPITIAGELAIAAEHLDLRRVSLVDGSGGFGAVFGQPLQPQTGTSVNQTRKGQLDLEVHGARTPAGVFTRVAQRLLALATAIWHNWATGATSKRSLIAYDH
jgi:hypothetical protein